MTDLLLGLDIGTTVTKCVLLDPGRGVIATDSRPVTLATVRAGWAEEDPATWWRNACELIPALLTAVGAGRGDVRGIGVVAGLSAIAGRTEPDPRTAGRYAELYAVYRSLYPALLDQQHTLARLSEGPGDG